MEYLCIKSRPDANAYGSPVDMSQMNVIWCLYDGNYGCRYVEWDVRYLSE